MVSNGERGWGHSPIGSLACSVVVRACRCAVCASVIRRRQTAAIVVAELDNDEIAGLDLLRHGGEATLAGETARRTASDGVVDDCDVHVVLERRTPALGAVVVSGSYHRRVACQIQRWSAAGKAED